MIIRQFSPREVLNKILPERQRLDISRVSDISDFNPVGLRLVQAVRTNTVKGQVSATTGKGFTLLEATCGALCEALERHAAAHFPQNLVVNKRDIGSQRDIQESFGYSTTAQVQDFIAAEDVGSAMHLWVPAIEVLFPYHGSDLGQLLIRPHTSGLACGATLAEASLYGLCEVVERYSTSLLYQRFQNNQTGQLINPVSVTDERFQRLYSSVREHGAEMIILRVSALIPTYYVAILDYAGLGPRFMFSSAASSLSERDAIVSALMGAIQGLIVGTQGAREDLSRYQTYYASSAQDMERQFFLIRDILSRLNPTSDFPVSGFSGGHCAKSAFELIRCIIASHGFKQILRCELPSAVADFSVVKILVPGMFDQHVNPQRTAYVTRSAA
ncbi:YcaO-like family protein [Pseudomonas coronafaciens]|uniref:YcaO-like family protein n=1 Tax=Pseudomonas coronafaciens TaxID=53409 RepID=UPI000EFE46F0|nr:YcaO-like family protein [Pseudomonas coronafaciens]RMV62098.1 hypothetical protein ALP06_200223 [Pseudomonas coronafaciens pv. atropurpurea]